MKLIILTAAWLAVKVTKEKFRDEAGLPGQKKQNKTKGVIYDLVRKAKDEIKWRTLRH